MGSGRPAIGAALARAVIAAARHLEPGRALRLGASLGRLWVRAGGPRTDVARRNLELCFPDRDAAWREGVLQESFENVGRSLAEVALLHGRHRDELIARVAFEGLEHLDAALDGSSAGGAFVMTAHFGAWELGGAALAARGYALTSVHRARDDDALDALVAGFRESTGQEVAALGTAGIGALRAVRRGRVVLMLLDQNARRREGVFAPFFGLAASTRSGPARLAARLDVPVVPAFIHRLPGGERHVVRFQPALELRGAADDGETTLVSDVTRMNGTIEAAIRSDPAQWVWTHRRFRTRPDAEASPYPKRSRRLRRLRRALRGRS